MWLNEFEDSARDRAGITETDLDSIAALATEANDSKSAAKLNFTNPTAESKGAFLFCGYGPFSFSTHNIEYFHLFQSLGIIIFFKQLDLTYV
jgi:hypothetical protein